MRLIGNVARIVWVLLALLGTVTALTVATPLTAVLAHRLSGPIADPSAPTLIVLSAAGASNDILSDSSYWRSVYAVRAWRGGGFQRILLVGAAAAPMRRFLISEGVSPDHIDIEEKSQTTRENALFTAALLRSREQSTPVLMTSDFHMFRARRCFESAGVHVLCRPIPDAIKRAADWRTRPTVLAVELEELVKIAAYRVRGWI